MMISKVAFIEENQVEVTDSRNQGQGNVLAKIKQHPMWQTFNSRCISC